MARAALVPKHVSLVMTMAETFDLIVTLRAATRDFGDSMPESTTELLEQLEGVYDGDLPQPVDTDPGEGGAAVATA